MARSKTNTSRAGQSDLRSFFGVSSSAGDAVVTPSTSRKRKRPPTNSSAFGCCPLCNQSFPYHTLESHASTCQGIPEPIPSSKVAETSSFKSIKKYTPLARDASGTRSNESSTATSPTPLLPPISKAISPLKPTCVPLPGLLIFEDFITEEEESRILETLDNPQRPDHLPWKPSTFNGKHFGKRWGVHCDLKARQVTASASDDPLPWFMTEILIPKLRALQLATMRRMNWVPNEANAIDYRRQQGHYLRNHVDNRQLSKEPIANLSLAGNCYMTFIHERRNQQQQKQDQQSSGGQHTKRVLLKRRCLQVLTGEARYDYSHGIRHEDLLTDRRVSLTMRDSPLTSAGPGIKSVGGTAARLPANQRTLHAILQKK